MHIPKKSFGQNFLTDDNIAGKIVNSLNGPGSLYKNLIEVGPGKGRLSKHILDKFGDQYEIFLIELDHDLVSLLKKTFPAIENHIILGNFLELDTIALTNNSQYGLIGNFPYNISGPILFNIIDHRQWIPEVVGMFQKEVVQRIASESGNKVYGIPSVMIQAYYKVEILFHVNENVFTPKPAVKSSVLRLTRIRSTLDDCNDDLFKKVVKSAFSKRRKTLKNALNSIIEFSGINTIPDVFKLRAEQLSVNDFIELTRYIEKNALLKSN